MMAVCFSLLSWGCVTLAVSTFRVPSLQNKSEDCVAVMPIKLSSRYPWIWLLNKTEMIDTKWPVPFHWSLVLFALATNNNWFSLPVGPLHWNPCMNIISHPAPRLSSSLLCATHSSPRPKGNKKATSWRNELKGVKTTPLWLATIGPADRGPTKKDREFCVHHLRYRMYTLEEGRYDRLDG